MSTTVARDELNRSLDTLNGAIRRMASLAVSGVDRAARAFVAADRTLAQEVRRDDAELDALAIDVERLVIETYARHQPVAGDLRLLHVSLLTSTHLERVGDLAVDLARLAQRVEPGCADDELEGLIETLGIRAASVLEQAVAALLNRDVAYGTSLAGQDDAVDALFEMALERMAKIGAAPEAMRRWAVEAVLAAPYLERVADHVVEIGRRIRFLVPGQIDGGRDAGGG